MAQFIEKDKIEEILRQLWKQDDGSNPEHRICFNKALQEVQCEIDKLDTIGVKDVDLEEEVKSYIHDNTCNGYFRADIHDVAEHFFELGLKVQKGE